MAKRKPPRATTSSNQAVAPETDTVAGQARQMAVRINRLADDVVASFVDTDADQRVSRLHRIANQIALGMLPVINWIERRRPPEAADLVRSRLVLVLDEVVACPRYDIPEYAGGKKNRRGGPPSDGAKRTASLFVTANAFAVSLEAWANDIEAEQVRHDNLDGRQLTPQANIPNPNDARDKFCYDKMMQGKNRAWIRNHLRKTWEQLESEQAVSAAAKRYAARHNLPWPISRQ